MENMKAQSVSVVEKSVEIDLRSGLPVLPEGFRWQIVENRGTLEVIIEEAEKRQPRREKAVETRRWWIFEWNKEVEKEVDVVFWRPKFYESVTEQKIFGEAADKEALKKEGWVLYSVKGGGYDGERNLEPTVANVMGVVEEVYTSFKEWWDRKQAVAKFVGVYPPKSMAKVQKELEGGE